MLVTAHGRTANGLHRKKSGVCSAGCVLGGAIIITQEYIKWASQAKSLGACSSGRVLGM